MNANDIATRADIARVEAKLTRVLAALEAVQIAPRGVWKTYAEAAAMLGVSVSTIARRVDSGELADASGAERQGQQPGHHDTRGRQEPHRHYCTMRRNRGSRPRPRRRSSMGRNYRNCALSGARCVAW